MIESVSKILLLLLLLVAVIQFLNGNFVGWITSFFTTAPVGSASPGYTVPVTNTAGGVTREGNAEVHGGI
jgi:hypothetical protein